MKSKDGYSLLHHGTLALSQIEQAGIKVDVKYLDNAVERTGNDIKELERRVKGSSLFKTWKRTFRDSTKIGSREQLARVLLDELEFTSKATTETGRLKLDEAALSNIDHPFVRDWIKIEKLKKIKNTYLAGIKREVTSDGFIHPVCNLNIATSMRSSYSDPNFQNIPVRDPEAGKLVRRCFIPRSKNHCLVDLDYSQIEVRTAACYNRDPTLIAYIKDKTKDMHRDMAAQIYKCPPDKVSKVARYCAKNQFVFPEFYGSYFAQCAPILHRSIDVHKLEVDRVPMLKWLRRQGIRDYEDFESHVEAVEKDFWHRRFKVYNQWKRDWVQKYNERGWCRMLTGFKVSGHLGWKEIINYPIQGSAFHCLLQSLIWIQRKMQKVNWGYLIGQIHDDLIGDIHKSRVSEYLSMAKEIMVDRLAREWKWLIVPLEIEAEVTEPGGNWHTKQKVEI